MIVYLIQGNSKGVPFFYERDLPEMAYEPTVKDLLTGQFDAHRLERVLEMDTETLQLRDVSERFAEILSARSIEEREELPSTYQHLVDAHGFVSFHERDPDYAGKDRAYASYCN